MIPSAVVFAVLAGGAPSIAVCGPSEHPADSCGPVMLVDPAPHRDLALVFLRGGPVILHRHVAMNYAPPRPRSSRRVWAIAAAVCLLTFILMVRKR